jgi:hypothetical protein
MITKEGFLKARPAPRADGFLVPKAAVRAVEGGAVDDLLKAWRFALSGGNEREATLAIAQRLAEICGEPVRLTGFSDAGSAMLEDPALWRALVCRVFA